MRHGRLARFIPLVAVLLALTAACGSGDKGEKGDGSLFKNPPFGQASTTAPPAGEAQAQTQPAGGDRAVTGTARTPRPGNRPPVFPGAQASGGSCEINMSGDVSATFKGKGGSGAAGTDYWLTEDEIRQALKLFAGIGGNRSQAEIDKEIEQKLKDDPRIYLLILNCEGQAGDQQASVSLLPANGSKYADVPFGPKKYVIAAGGVLGGDARSGQFTALLSLGEGVYKIPEPGELNITKFDKSGIAGTFKLKAEELFSSGTPKKVTIEGKFDYPCSGVKGCKR